MKNQIDTLTIARLFQFARRRLTGPRANEVASLAGQALAARALDGDDRNGELSVATSRYYDALVIADMQISRNEFYAARWNEQDWFMSNAPCGSLGYSHAAGYQD